MHNYGQQLKVDGAIVFSCLTQWTDQQKLAAGLAACGFEKSAPAPRTHRAALEDAMKNLFPRHRIEELEEADSWEVVRIVRGKDANTYIPQNVIQLREEFGNPKILLTPYDTDTAGKLVGHFNEFLGLVKPAQVTAALTGIITLLNGTSLRPKGSIYWIPGTAADRWAEVCAAVEAAGTGHGNRCHLIRHQLDGDALKAVRDAIVREVQDEVARIEADVQSGELKERGLNNRKDEAVALREKLRLYEETLHVGMGEMHALIDQAEQTALSAAMLASIGSEVA